GAGEDHGWRPVVSAGGRRRGRRGYRQAGWPRSPFLHERTLGLLHSLQPTRTLTDGSTEPAARTHCGAGAVTTRTHDDHATLATSSFLMSSIPYRSMA